MGGLPPLEDDRPERYKKMKTYSLEWTHKGKKQAWSYHADDDAEVIRLLKTMIIMSKDGVLPTIDFSCASARRQWEDGTRETIISVVFENSDIYAFTAVYNFRTFNFEYVSETLPA